MNILRMPIVICCLMLWSTTSSGQGLSVAEYLATPTKINARTIAQQSPEILSELIKTFEMTEDVDVRIACLVAINATSRQTEQSRNFLRELANLPRSTERPKSVKWEVLDWLARFGWNLNRLLSDEEGAKTEFVHICNLLRVERDVSLKIRSQTGNLNSPDLFWIGGRFSEVLAKFSNEDPSSEMVALIPLTADNRSQSETDDLAYHVLDRHFETLSAAKDDSLADEYDVNEVVYRVTAAANLQSDVVFRKWLTKTLERSDTLPHLATYDSRGIAVIRVCLSNLKTHEILKSDFEKLKTLEPFNKSQEGRDDLEYPLIFAEDMLKIVRGQPKEGVPSRSKNPLWVLNYADQLACEILPSYLAIDLPEGRNAETQLVAQQAISIVQDRNPAAARRVYIGLAGQLIKTGEDEKIATALDLLRSLKPIESDRRFVERIAFGAEPLRSPFVKAKAISLLAFWDAEETEKPSSAQMLEKFVAANLSGFDFEQQIDLTNDVADMDRGTGVRMLIQLIEAAKTPEDKQGVIENIVYQLGINVEEPIRLNEIERQKIYPVAPIVFEQLGAMNGEFNATDAADIFTNEIAFGHPDGLKVLADYIKQSTNDKPRRIAGSMIFNHLDEAFRSSILALNNFAAENLNFEDNPIQTNWELEMGLITNLLLLLDGDRPDMQQRNLQILLESHSRVMEELKTIAADEDHQLQAWAKKKLEELRE